MFAQRLGIGHYRVSNSVTTDFITATFGPGFTVMSHDHPLDNNISKYRLPHSVRDR